MKRPFKRTLAFDVMNVQCGTTITKQAIDHIREAIGQGAKPVATREPFNGQFADLQGVHPTYVWRCRFWTYSVVGFTASQAVATWYAFYLGVSIGRPS